MPVPVIKLRRVELQHLRLALTKDSFHLKGAVEKAAADVVLDGTHVVALAQVEDQAGGLPCADEHGQLDLLAEIVWIGNVDHHLAVRGVLVAKGGPSVVVLTGGSQEGAVAFTLVLLPQVRTFAVIHTRIRITLSRGET